MSVQIIRGNALDLPLADDSVDLVVTSPPYFGLRSYQDRCADCNGVGRHCVYPNDATRVWCPACSGTGRTHYDGQIGSEATPTEFVDALIAATREMVRVVKPSGSIFVNLGDKYVADNRGSGSDAKRGAAKHAPVGPAGYVGEGVMPRKSLMGIPWRYALRCIDDLGLILRAEIIWSKPNGLPESVTDRVRRSHEQWFHFVQRPRYYSAVDEIREAPVYPQDAGRARKGYVGKPDAPAQYGNTAGDAALGKLPGSVWSVPTQPLQVPAHLGVDHFAAFPMAWPRRIIQAWAPSSGTVLDPFGGTGTTALVAHALGRHGITVDMSHDYSRLAEWRCNDPGELAKAMQVEKPPQVPADQLGFDFGEATA